MVSLSSSSLIICKLKNERAQKTAFSIGKEKLVAPLIAIPNVDKGNRRLGTT